MDRLIVPSDIAAEMEPQIDDRHFKRNTVLSRA